MAVVGASSRKLTIGREILHNMIEFEFTGPVYAINPKASVVHSMKAYKTLKDVPDDIDLVVISVPRERVMTVVEECGRKGVKGLVIISAGFREIGPEGEERCSGVGGGSVGSVVAVGSGGSVSVAVGAMVAVGSPGEILFLREPPRGLLTPAGGGGRWRCFTRGQLVQFLFQEQEGMPA